MTAHEPVSIRFLRVSDDQALLAHLNAAFAGWPKIDLSVPAIDHLRWKLSNETGVSECSTVAEVGARIVGALLFVGQSVRTCNGELLAAHGVDWGIRPGYQGRGIMPAMRSLALERLNEQADFNLGQSGNARVTVLHQREGYLRMANQPERLVLRLPTTMPSLDHTFSIMSAAEFDERSDRFWAEAARSFDYIGVRDRRWLNWRYCDRRAGEFTVRLAELDGELLGYSVFRVSTQRNAGYIADLLTLPERVDIADALVHDALAAFGRERVETAECWLPKRHPYRATLDTLGFVPRSRRWRMIYKAVRLPEPQLAFLGDRRALVHFTLGDSDLV